MPGERQISRHGRHKSHKEAVEKIINSAGAWKHKGSHAVKNARIIAPSERHLKSVLISDVCTVLACNSRMKVYSFKPAISYQKPALANNPLCISREVILLVREDLWIEILEIKVEIYWACIRARPLSTLIMRNLVKNFDGVPITQRCIVSL